MPRPNILKFHTIDCSTLLIVFLKFGETRFFFSKILFSQAVHIWLVTTVLGIHRIMSLNICGLVEIGNGQIKAKI